MADTTTPTELDKAQAFVQENPDEIHVFYNTFLNSVLYLPTHNGPEGDAVDKDEAAKELRPIFAQSGDILYLMLFDSLERLSAWAKKDTGYVGLQGHAVLDMMDPKFHWFLNYGSENGREFGSEEIAWLKSAVQRASQPVQQLEVDEDALMEQPGELPEGLIEALSNVAGQYPGVLKTALGTFFMQDKMDQPDLALAIEAGSIHAEERENMLNAFTEAARSVIAESEEFWIFISGETDLADRLLAEVEPFYRVDT